MKITAMKTYLVLILILLLSSKCEKESISPGTPSGGYETIYMPYVYEVENTGSDCISPPLPKKADLPVIEALPNPFEWSDKNKGIVKNYEEWLCRRAEIATEIQHYELGVKPGPPDELSANFADGIMTINMKHNNNDLKLTANIFLPGGEGPFPAMIGVGFTPTGSLPGDLFANRKIALIQYNFEQLAPWQPSRGDGAFYNLFPDPKVGSFTAWSWGISRIIDGLELLPELDIDMKHLAITGCSFAGKIALFGGAFDERIALTISQEPGGGGDAAWRVSETLDGSRETLRNAQGVAWYHQDLSQFNEAVTKLPYDHHELMSIVAPRALLILGNPDYEWLAEESGHVACKAAKKVYSALGVPDRFGFSKLGGHSHCQLPNSQRPEVEAFIDRFLLNDQSVDTNFELSPYNTNLVPWINWGEPKLNH